MKIGINARTFTVDEPGGAVQTSIKHTKGLIERADTKIILFGSTELESVFPDTPVVTTGYPVKSQIYGTLWERVALPTLADRSDIDVLYCPNGNAPATRTSCPVVMCIHDVNALKGWSSCAHQLYRKTTVPCGAKWANTITTVSEFSKGEIVQHLSVPESKVSVVYNGVDRFFFSTESEQPDCLPNNYLLFVGSMNPRKNLERVIKSYLAVKERTNHSYKLVIIGPENKNIFKSVTVGDLDDIITPGYVTLGELKFAYEKADVFVFPSLYEGFGLPPLEALACGTPIVASETTSLGEIIQEGCIHVDPENVQDIADAIVQILNNEELAMKLATEGKAYARKFTWKKATRQLREVLSKTI